MFTCSSAFDFMPSKNWKLHCPQYTKKMHFLSFISVISQNETDCHNVTFWENSSKEGSWVGWDQPAVSSCFFGRSLLTLQKGWWSCICTCEKNHFSTEMQCCGWRHIDRKVLGWFGFFPFHFPAFFGWGVKFFGHSLSRLLPCARLCMHTDPRLVCSLSGWSVVKICLLLQLLQCLGFILVLQVVEILCSLWCCSKYLRENSISRTEMLFPAWCNFCCFSFNKDLKYSA